MEIKAIDTIYNGYKFRSKNLPIEPKKKMSSKVDITGQRFGRLLVVECLGIATHGFRWWGCICDCGNKVAVRSRELFHGDTRSCGCLQSESRAHYGGLAGHNKLSYGHAARNELFSSYKKSARKRGIAWELSAKQFFDIVSLPCAYCGAPPDSVRKPNKGVNGEFIYSGVDRIDNNLGYIAGNVTPCCWICNRAKGTLSLHEFSKWCERLFHNTKARQARFEHGEKP
jgi:hypothetical protein